MDYPTCYDPDAFEAEALSCGHIAVAGKYVDCFACQVSGPYSAADGSVVYVTPVARHHHQGSPYVCAKQLEAGYQGSFEDERAAMVAGQFEP